MNYDDVKLAAGALINTTGMTAKMNSLTKSVRTSLLTSHAFEQFLSTMQITYAAAESLDLNVNAFQKVFRIMAIKVNDADRVPPRYITPKEWSRKVAQRWDSQAHVKYWTQIGRRLYLLGPIAVTLDVVYMRSAANVGWGEIEEDFLDYAGAILARKLLPLESTNAAGEMFANPAYEAAMAVEEVARKKLIDLEYRQPGRDYEVKQDRMRTIRNESYDY